MRDALPLLRIVPGKHPREYLDGQASAAPPGYRVTASPSREADIENTTNTHEDITRMHAARLAFLGGRALVRPSHLQLTGSDHGTQQRTEDYQQPCKWR